MQMLIWGRMLGGKGESNKICFFFSKKLKEKVEHVAVKYDRFMF